MENAYIFTYAEAQNSNMISVDLINAQAKNQNKS